MKKKKVLYIGMSAIIGGVETYIMNLIENLDLNEFEPYILIQKEQLSRNYRERIEKVGGVIIEVENFKKHPLKSYNSLKKIYQKYSIDVIHANICNASSILYALPSKKINKKTNIIVHSHTSNDSKRIQHYIFRILLNKIVDCKIACSELAAKWMFGKNNNDAIIVNNAINLEKYKYNHNVSQKIKNDMGLSGKFVIGHIGRFEDVKNHEFIIDIFTDILKSEPNAVLLLVGTGSLLENIKNKVKNNNIEKKVVFYGTSDDTSSLYKTMDVFILPSKYEGLPIVGVEAQAAGLKCIFSNNVSKLTNITENCEFISLDNKKDWINRILDSRKYERTSDVDKLRKRGYDLKEEVKKIENLYRQ